MYICGCGCGERGGGEEILAMWCRWINGSAMLHFSGCVKAMFPNNQKEDCCRTMKDKQRCVVVCFFWYFLLKIIKTRVGLSCNELKTWADPRILT